MRMLDKQQGQACPLPDRHFLDIFFGDSCSVQTLAHNLLQLLQPVSRTERGWNDNAAHRCDRLEKAVVRTAELR